MAAEPRDWQVGTSRDGFWPSPSRILPIAQDSVWPAHYMAWVVGPMLQLDKLALTTTSSASAPGRRVVEAVLTLQVTCSPSPLPCSPSPLPWTRAPAVFCFCCLHASHVVNLLAARDTVAEQWPWRLQRRPRGVRPGVTLDSDPTHFVRLEDDDRWKSVFRAQSTRLKILC